ncbi:MAG TPA: septum formation initiator family protein [Gemmatimonadaceae bacterium]|nr:septum formation initiator family protein [Gemmatimonadaceae bacterium]
MRDNWRGLVWIAIGAVVLVYALQGGEYSTTALLSQRARATRMGASMDSLRHEIDSLARVKKAVLADPQVQERIAREEFGMVRGNKEILYRFAEPDSARKP